MHSPARVVALPPAAAAAVTLLVTHERVATDDARIV
jgi:hypothetical protein